VHIKLPDSQKKCRSRESLVSGEVLLPPSLPPPRPPTPALLKYGFAKKTVEVARVGGGGKEVHDLSVYAGGLHSLV
jgi:hypothetical protein